MENPNKNINGVKTTYSVLFALRTVPNGPNNRQAEVAQLVAPLIELAE